MSLHTSGGQQRRVQGRNMARNSDLRLETGPKETEGPDLDPTGLEPGENLEENQRNLLQITERFFQAIIGSSNEFPPQLRSVCHCLYQATCHSLLNKATRHVSVCHPRPSMRHPVTHRAWAD
ncbi:neurofibromin isoform X1 [Lates japonicus]|uniref:Neurofibromin isoform X1 n=1 Tax=Lates japonicus TaxID=270547 RepID=A0AAD3N301_LATJO|nr:neurofibromin isoform X1 [Lates japonicus]